MKLRFLVNLLLLSCVTHIVTSQNLKIIGSDLNFTAKMLGVKVQGTLKGLQGNISFDPSSLATASIVGTVDAQTIDTDNSLRNKHIKEKSEFFEVAKFPKIKMASTKIEKLNEAYLGHFLLTIKNITKPIKIKFNVDSNGEKLIFKGATTINRKDWKIGGNTFGMSDDVLLNLQIITIKQ